MAAPTPSPASATGLLNLEKELICFICTEVLYQPLTLIDCLHTFCGSCLKEWFSHQHRKASHSHTPIAQPYTCPTCRATVKDAQHNAMINTLLDMFLSANPNKARSEEEKAEMAKIYKPNENILPKVDSRRRERRRREQDEIARRERRAAEQSREWAARNGTTASPPTRPDDLLSPRHAHQTSRSRSRGQGGSGTRDHDDRRERRIQERQNRRERRGRGDDADEESRSDLGHSEGEDTVAASLSPPLSSPRHPDAVEARQRGARTVAHQASLRSLVSASDSGTGTGESIDEAQLMQEILAEGLLDGIDVDRLTEAEQDHLSEVIAQRYRELHPNRTATRSTSTISSAASPPPIDIQSSMNSLRISSSDTSARRRSSGVASREEATRPPSTQSTVRPTREVRPPSAYVVGSRDRTESASETTRNHRRRASDQTGRPDLTGGRTAHPATRSATDLSDHPQSNSPDLRRLSADRRVSTEPRRSPRASQSQPVASPPTVDSPPALSPPIATVVPLATGLAATQQTPRSVPQDGPVEVDGTSAVGVVTRFEEPSISCYRCNRRDIQYDVYKHCAPCGMDLCLRCYRNGRGCNHWFGFGHAAMVRFDASHPRRQSQVIELPHVLVGRQYLRPSSDSNQQTDSGRLSTTSDPASRLQEGHFCDHCGDFANACFWSCDYCNEGEWGFCNKCVNTHHCCSHALLPVAHKLFAPGNALPRSYDPHTGPLHLTPADAHASFVRPIHNRSSPAHSVPSSATGLTDASMAGPYPDYVNLTITTNCDICTSPIPPADSRYHCPTHPSPTPAKPTAIGDYDICTPCYHNLVKIGRISRDNGPAGWRKCAVGHRMIVTVFEASAADAGGQRRIILNDLVGGLKMSGEDIAAWQASLDKSDPAAPPPPSSFVPRGQWTWRDPNDPAEEAGANANGRRSRSRKSTLLQNLNAQEGGKKTSRFPPDGGFGKVCRALWSYYPEEGEEGKGELLFPKGAVIGEVEDINEEWWEGVYAGERGLVPAVFVREV